MNYDEIGKTLLVFLYAFDIFYWFGIYVILKRKENEKKKNAQIEKDTNKFISFYERMEQNGGGTISINNPELISEDVLSEHLLTSQKDNISINIIVSSVDYSNIPNDR